MPIATGVPNEPSPLGRNPLSVTNIARIKAQEIKNRSQLPSSTAILDFVSHNMTLPSDARMNTSILISPPMSTQKPT